MDLTPRVLPFLSARQFSTVRGDLLPGCDALRGPSVVMERLRSQIWRVAPHFRMALLIGEDGTGCECVARTLHEGSRFREIALVPLSAEAAEARLAVPAGTQQVVYLEEAERLSRSAQGALLRLVRARGTRAPCVIARTRVDLKALASAGSFSGELAAALSALRITLPSLRERREDVSTLLRGVVMRQAEQLQRPAPRLAEDFVAKAEGFDWPGNLVQMEEMVRWLLENRAAEELRGGDFEAACEGHKAVPGGAVQAVRMIRLEQLVQEHTQAVLLACHGNKLRAAEVLGISRSTLYRMLDAGMPFSMTG
jgi:DNA-binding NtrC family response regulator